MVMGNLVQQCIQLNDIYTPSFMSSFFISYKIHEVSSYVDIMVKRSQSINMKALLCH